MHLPRLIVTSGEPAGIGPDICLALAEREWPCELVVAGDVDVLQDRARRLGLRTRIERIKAGASTPHQVGTLSVLHVPLAEPCIPGRLNAANAQAVLSMLDLACDGCLNHRYDAMVTAPVQKSVINDAGVPFSGHTEYLAERCGGSYPVMMLAHGSLRVALATTHLPLRDVSGALTPALLERVISILDHDLRTRFGIDRPRLLICGLNPHAGESGHLGTEEIEVIAPVLQKLRGRGLELQGPAPADTAFTPHMLKDADAVLAMYHDQGLPVLKYAGFDSAVNVTLGLPIVRTSVDHGTALSLAGTGKAEAGSLFCALELAIELSSRSRSAQTS